MTEPIHDSDVVPVGEATAASAKRRKSLLRYAILLAIATGALILFILLLGDLRRQSSALAQMKRYTGILTARLGEKRSLPLNLELDVSPEQASGTPAFEHLSREQAWLLRDRDKRIIVAQTFPVRQRLLFDGRAVVFFEQGRFSFEWFRADDFDKLYAAQVEELRRRGTGETAAPAGARGR